MRNQLVLVVGTLFSFPFLVSKTGGFLVNRCGRMTGYPEVGLPTRACVPGLLPIGRPLVQNCRAACVPTKGFRRILT
jgi:hypothetical protein